MPRQEWTVANFTLASEALRTDRLVSVFVPPGNLSGIDCPVLYCPDGHALGMFADSMASAAECGHVPPIVLVGVHCDPEFRNREYLIGLDNNRFAAHETFFADEVYRWFPSKFPFVARRELCGVFGYSCGAAFALTIGNRHREKFGYVIAFSVAGGSLRFEKSEFRKQPTPRFYLSAGTKELSCRDTVQVIAGTLSTLGIDHRYTERNAGHNPEFWCSELVEASRWCFPPPIPC